MISLSRLGAIPSDQHQNGAEVIMRTGVRDAINTPRMHQGRCAAVTLVARAPSSKQLHRFCGGATLPCATAPAPARQITPIFSSVNVRARDAHRDWLRQRQQFVAQFGPHHRRMASTHPCILLCRAGSPFGDATSPCNICAPRRGVPKNRGRILRRTIPTTMPWQKRHYAQTYRPAQSPAFAPPPVSLTTGSSSSARCSPKAGDKGVARV